MLILIILVTINSTHFNLQCIPRQFVPAIFQETGKQVITIHPWLIEYCTLEMDIFIILQVLQYIVYCIDANYALFKYALFH